MTLHKKNSSHVVYFNVPRDWFETSSRHQKRYSEGGKKMWVSRSTGKSNTTKVQCIWTLHKIFPSISTVVRFLTAGQREQRLWIRRHHRYAYACACAFYVVVSENHAGFAFHPLLIKNITEEFVS